MTCIRLMILNSEFDTPRSHHLRPMKHIKDPLRGFQRSRSLDTYQIPKQAKDSLSTKGCQIHRIQIDWMWLRSFAIFATPNASHPWNLSGSGCIIARSWVNDAGGRASFLHTVCGIADACSLEQNGKQYKSLGLLMPNMKTILVRLSRD